MSPEREGPPEVSLRRLCAVARLGPGPVVAVARAVLGALAGLHLRGRVHGAVTADAVLVDDGGTVRLLGDGDRPARSPAEVARLQQDDVVAAWELIAALVAASPVTVPAELRALAAGPAPEDGAHAALAVVSAAAGELAERTGERRAVVRLAELVEPLRRYRHGPAQPTAGGLGAATVITAPHARVPAAPGPAGRPRQRRRARIAVAAVLAAAAAGGAGLLATRGSTGPALPLTAAPPAAATALPAAPSPPPIPDPPVVAPPTAGPVAAVALLAAAGPCLPAAQCALTLRVDLLPRHPATTVRLELELLDRCTGARSTIALAPLSVPAASPTGRSSVRVRVPAGPAPAIVAVTTSPARAASAPLLVAPYLPTCSF
jgi:hypothetical protein